MLSGVPIFSRSRPFRVAPACDCCMHALLCRPYLKGRDWFDFGWYVAQGATPNLPHLAAALDQYGPWQGQRQGVKLDRIWLESALLEGIRAIDWPVAARDVAPFLAAPEQAGLKLWSERFFAGKVAKLVLGLEARR